MTNLLRLAMTEGFAWGVLWGLALSELISAALRAVRGR